MNYDEKDVEIAAKTIYGEARGEGHDGQLAVAHVLVNRATRKRFAEEYLGKEGALTHVCLKPWQFSCWNDSDPNRAKLLGLSADDLGPYIDMVEDAIRGDVADPTQGADHYYADTITAPDWAAKFKQTAHIGHHIFFNSEEPAAVAAPPPAAVASTGMADGQITKNFWLSEFTRSDLARDLGIRNDPDAAAKANIIMLVKAVLQPIRDLLGHPVTITSGYRSSLLNRKVRGAVPNSQHTYGQAADFVCPGFGTPYEVTQKILSSGVPFDQLINEHPFGREHGWVHVSWAPKPRGEAWTIGPEGTVKGIVE